MVEKKVWAEEGIKEMAIRIIRESLGLARDREIKNEDKFADDLEADSLDVVELIMAFEENFGIEIPEEEADGIGSVGQAIKYLEKLL